MGEKADREGFVYIAKIGEPIPVHDLELGHAHVCLLADINGKEQLGIAFAIDQGYGENIFILSRRDLSVLTEALGPEKEEQEKETVNETDLAAHTEFLADLLAEKTTVRKRPRRLSKGTHTAR